MAQRPATGHIGAVMPTLTPLISERDIARRVGELASAVSHDYAEAGEIVLVGVLRGAFIFLADLARRLSVPSRVDFIALASYEHGSIPSSGVRLVLDLRSNVARRHVLIVEDIVDSGRTLHYLLKMLRARGPASIKTCVLTHKPARLDLEVPLDYVGFEIPDRWVVGYGLDYDDRYRTLPYIAAIDPDDEVTPSP